MRLAFWKVLTILALLLGIGVVTWLFLRPDYARTVYGFEDMHRPVELSKLDAALISVQKTPVGAAVDFGGGRRVVYKDELAAGDPLLKIQIGNDNFPLYAEKSSSGQTALESEDTTVIRGTLPGVAFRYTHHKEYLKEDIEATSASAARAISYVIKKDSGLKLSKNEAGGIVASKGEKLLFYIHPPTAVDAAKEKVGFRYELQEVQNEYRLTLVPENVQQLEKAAYPLTIDPTISWSFTDQSPYYLSDPAKIEIVGGVVRLVNVSGQYATDNPYVITNTPTAYTALSGFSQVLGLNNQGSVRYQLSRTGNAWYYWNGSTWTAAAETDYSQANDAATINAQMSSFTSQFGVGSVFVKAFLHASSATSQTELQSFSLSYTSPATPTLSGVSPSSGSYQGGTSVTVTGSNFSSYLYKKKITIDETKIPGSQTLQDYPLLINRVESELRSTANGGHVGKTNGGDIRFELPNGTKLDHEIEKYDPTTGELVAWVRVPYLSPTVNSDIWMKYGNAAAADQANPTAVWNSKYKAVYHLSDATPNDTFDTTVDATKWWSYGTPSINAGRLSLPVSTTTQWTTSGVDMLNKLHGDFDMQIDFDVSAWTNSIAADGHELNFRLGTLNADGATASNIYYYFAYYKQAGGSKGFTSWQNDTNVAWGSTTYTGTTSKMRLRRVGSTITSFYWNSNAWVQVGTTTGPHASDKMFLSIYTTNRASNTAVLPAYVDNFVMNVGGAIKDSTAYGNHGFNAGGATPTTSKIGGGMSFSGATTSYIQVPNSASLENIQEAPYSNQVWFNPTTLPTAVPDASYGLTMKIGYDAGIRYNNNGTFTFEHWTGGGSPASGAVSTVSGVPVGTSHMAVGTVDQTKGQSRLYTDGVMANNTFASSTTYDYAQYPWRIGVADPVNPTYRWLTKGVMDEVRLTSGVLSSDWVTTEYNNHTSPNTFYVMGGEESANGILFGGTSGVNTQIVDGSTIQTTTPTHALGTYDVTLVSAEGQTASLTNAFTFTSSYPAPTLGDITPSAGPLAGGTNVTITGSHFIPPNSGGEAGWVAVPGKTLPFINSASALAVIGSNIYLFGGYESAPTDRIMQASVADPTTWTDTGKKLPAALSHASIAVVNGSIYLFGGYNAAGTNVSVIYRASVADPTTWVNTGKTLPVGLRQTQVAVIGSNMYLYGGMAAGSVVNTIYRAATTDPTTWTLVSGRTLPVPLTYSTTATVGNYVYLFGGFTGSGYTASIYRAPITDPTAWADTGKTMPAALSYEKHSIAVIGDSLYIFGGSFGSTYTNAIYKASVADPTTWTTSASTMPSTLSLNSIAVIGNYIYSFGAWTDASQNYIYRAPLTQNRPNLYSPSWITDWTTGTADLSTVTMGGLPLTNVQYVNDTTITGTTPAHAAGSVDVSVINPDGQEAKLLGKFTYVPPPSVTQVTPNSVLRTGGDTITITGHDFLETPTVSFGGVSAASVTFVNATTLTVVTPVHFSGTYDVVVTNPEGQSATLANGITFREPLPTISDVSPSSGSITGGTRVTVTGSNFNFGDYGNGADGSVTLSANKNMNTDSVAAGRSCADAVNYSVTGLTANTATLSTAPAAGCLNVNDEVLLINQQGTNTDYVNVGVYETLRVASVSGSSVTFSQNKTKHYGNGASDDTNIGVSTSNQRVMLQRIPNYQNVTVANGVTLTASAWDGTKGGVLYFKSNGTVTNNGTIDLKGKGYQGSARAFSFCGYGGGSGIGMGYVNGVCGGGGGGSSASCSGGAPTLGSATLGGAGGSGGLCGGSGGGGGGGGYGSAGRGGYGVLSSNNGIEGGINSSGNGGASGGTYAGGGGGGGTYGDKTLSKLYLGSAGGTGGNSSNLGGSGGGVLAIHTKVFQNNGTVTVDGGGGASSADTAAGSGGGGSGGSLKVYAHQIAAGDNTVTARGGAGANSSGTYSGRGGEGGAGRVAFYSVGGATISGTTSPLYAAQSEALYIPGLTFGGASATDIISVDDTTITALTPAHTAGTVDVTITNYDGQSATLPSSFTFTNPPEIYSVTPSSVRKIGGDTVVISGAHFVNPASVTFDGITATSVTFMDAQTLSVVVPPHNPGVVDVVVTNTDGQTVTKQNGLTYTEAPPSALAINPTYGPYAGGTAVTITGGDFYTLGRYRKPVTVTNSNASELNNYQALVIMDTQTLISSGKMNADGSDLRFTDADGLTPLSYWIESNINTTTTHIWVKVPRLPAGGKTIYAVYGRASNIAQSDRASVFPKDLTGLIGNWDFNEASGSTAADTSSLNNTASLTNTTVSAGTFGNARTFNGTNASGLIPHSTTYNVTDFSINTWFKYSGAGASGHASWSLVAKNSGSIVAYNAPFQLWVTSSATLGGRVGNGTTNVDLNTDTVLAADSWHMATLTRSGTTVSLYLDGVLKDQRSITGSITNGSTISVGSWGPVFDYFKGAIDYLQLFNRSLSAQEVGDTYSRAPYVTTNVPQHVLLVEGAAVTPTTSVGAESAYGPTVTFGGVSATNVQVVDSNTITAVTPAHNSGTVDVVVTNPDGQTATLPAAYRYGVYKFALISGLLSLRETEPGAMTVQAQDQNGDPVILTTDATVALSASSASGFFARDLSEAVGTRWDYVTVVIPAGTSQITFYFKDNVKGQPTVSVASADDAFALGDSQQVVITSRYRLLVTGVTDPVKSGIPSSVTIQAIDFEGTPQHEYTGRLHFTSTDGAAALPEDSDITEAMLGGKTFVNGVTMITQGTWCVTATDVNDSDISGTQCNIDVSAPNQGVIASLDFITDPQVFAATGQSSVITVQAHDADGVPVPVSSDTPIYLHTDSGTGGFSKDGSTNWNNTVTLVMKAGTTSVSFYYKDTTLGQHAITAREDAGTGADFGWRNATQVETVGTGGAYRVVLIPPTQNPVAGQTSQAYRVVLRDELGNDVFLLGSQTIQLTTSGGTALFSPSGNFALDGVSRLPLVITPGNSGADFYYRDDRSGTRTMTASDSNPPNGDTGLLDDTISVTVDGAPAYGFAFTTGSFEAVAGAVSPTVSVELRDSLGNRSVAAADTTVYLSASQPGGVFLSADGSIVITSVVILAGQSSADFKFKQTQFSPTQTLTVSDATPADGTIGLDDASQVETITTGGAAKIAVTSGVIPSAAAGLARGPITVALQNQYGVEVPAAADTTIYFRSSSAGGGYSLDGSAPWVVPLAYTILSGESNAVMYYRDTLAGSATLTFSDEPSGTDTGLTNATLSVVTVAGPRYRLAFISAAQNLTAGQVSAVMTVRQEDEYGNVVPASGNVPVSLSSTGVTGRFDTSAGGNFNGIITSVTIPSAQQSVNFYYRDNEAGSPVITASAAGLVSAMQTQQVAWGSVSRVSLSGPSSVVAGQASTAFTLRTYNTYNVNVSVGSDATIQLTSPSGTMRFDTQSGGPFDGSITTLTVPSGSNSAVFYVKDTHAGSQSLTASYGSATASASITVTASTPAQLVFITNPQTLELGQTSAAITVRAVDQFGNTATASSQIVLNLSTSGANGQIRTSGGNQITTVNIEVGASQASFYYYDTDVGSPIISVSASGYATITQTETIVYGSPAQMSLWTADNQLKAGTPSGDIYIYTVNQYGVVVPTATDFTANLSVQNSTTGRFDTSSGGSFASLTLGVTVVSGSSSGIFYYRDTTQKSGVRIAAAHSGMTTVTYVFNVDAGDPASLTFTNPVRTTVAGIASAVLTVNVYDLYGNATVATAPIAVSINDSEASAQLATSVSGPWNSGPLAAVIDTGQQSTSFYYKDTIAGTKTLTASSPGLGSGSQNTTVNAAAFHHLGFTTSEQTVVVMNVSGVISLAGYDQYNNPRTFPSLTLTLSTGSPDGTFSVAAAPFTPVTQIPIANGASTASFYYKDARLANTVLTVTPTGYSAASQAINIIPGNAAGLRFISAPQTVIKDTASSAIEVQLSDANGYPSTSGNLVSALLSSSSGTGEFSLDGINGWNSTLTLDYQPGESKHTAYYRDSTEGTMTMTASASGLTSGTQDIVIIPGTISQIVLSGGSTATAGVPLALTITSKTAEGLPAAVSGNTTVQLATDHGGQFSLSDTNWQPITSVVIPARQYQVALFYRNTTAGEGNLTVNAQNGLGWGQGSLTVDVGAGSLYRFVFVGLPMSVNAGTASSAIVIQARDQYGNLVLLPSDKTVYLYGPASAQFAANGAGPWDATQVEILAGSGTATFYFNDSLPGNKTLTASDATPLDAPDAGVINATGQVAVSSLPPVSLRYTSAARSITAGTASDSVTVEAVQSNNSPAVVGAPLVINLTSTIPGALFYASAAMDAPPITTVTIPLGGSQATYYVYAEKSGTHSITAASGSLTSAVQSFTVTAADGAKFAVTTATQTKTAGVASDQITLQLQDEFGNKAVASGGVQVELSTNSVSGEFSLSSGAGWSGINELTLLSGESELYMYYRDTSSGVWTLAFHDADGGITDAHQNFTVSVGNAARLRFLSGGQTLVAGQVSSLIGIQLTDIYGNAAQAQSDLTVYLSTTSGQGSFSEQAAFDAAITAITLSSGSSATSFYYKDLASGSPVITVGDRAPPDSPDLGLQNDTVTFTITSGTPDHLVITASPTALAGQSTLLHVELRNAYDALVNAAAGITLYFGTTSSGGTFAPNSAMNSPSSSVTIPAGSSSIDYYYQDTSAGTATVSVRDTVAADPDVGITDASVSINVLSATIAKLRFISIAPQLEMGEISGPMTFQAQDVYGNAVLVPSDVTVYLSSSVGSGSFSLSSGFDATTTSVVIASDTSTATFYYKDSVAGNPIVTASDTVPATPDIGLLNAMQTLTITSGSITELAWLDMPSSLEAGEVSGALRIQSQNRFGVPVPVTSDTTIYVSHSAGTGGFSTGLAGPWNISQITMLSGQSVVTVYYRNSAASADTLTAADNMPPTPDSGWTNASTTLTITPGVPTQIIFTSSSPTVIARHPSSPITIETRNDYGVAAPVTTQTSLYMRSSSVTGEFAEASNGPWGVNYVSLGSGSSDATAYYHDSTVGTPLLTVSDNLPISPDVAMTNDTMTATIVPQVLHHFLVTNISTPQIQGSPSSVVVAAQDAENYIIDNYTGTVTFSSSDADAILPGPYTFQPTESGEGSIHTFGNGVAFLHSGIKSVTVTDQNGITGSQTNIIVNGNTAGPIAGLQFIGVTPPLVVNKNSVSQQFTLQSIDSNGQPSNASDGGFAVRLTSSSPGGQFATSASGPWSSTLVTSIPAHLSSINLFYRDSSVGAPTVTAADWVDAIDSAGIQNATLAVQVRALALNVSETLQVNNNSHYYENSSLIFSKNHAGDYRARGDYAVTITDETSDLSHAADLSLKWYDPSGSLLATQTASNVSSYTYHIDPIDGTMRTGAYTLEVRATDPVTGLTGQTSYQVTLSGWVVKIEYDPADKAIGQPLPYTVKTYYNGVLTDPAMFTVNFRDDNGDDIAGSQYRQTIGDLTRTSAGFYSGSIQTAGLSPTDGNGSNAYYLYTRVFNSSTNQTLAEDNHFDIFFINDPALAPKNFQIEKIQTSTPPADETYNLKFSWDGSAGATSYVVYRSQNKNAGLYTDPCTIAQVQGGHRYSDPTSRLPFCETAGQQVVGTDDTISWVELGRVNAPTTTLTMPWAQLQADLPSSTYYYLVRAENGAGSSGYSTMAVSVKKHFTTNDETSSVNWLALPYNAGNYTSAIGTSQRLLKASDIVKDIEGGTGNGTNKKTSRLSSWASGIQSTSNAYFYSSTLHRWTGVDFTITPGDAVYVQATHLNGFDWTSVGSDTVQSLTLTPNQDGKSNVNWLSLPYSGMYLRASDIVKDIEGSTVGSVGNDKTRYINRLSNWSTGIQSTSNAYFYSNTLHRWTGVDFPIEPGDGIYLQLSGGALPLLWSPPLIINPNN